MQTLERLTDQARALAQGEAPSDPAEAEVARQLQICNACRYCEGFCAVFPAMTRRLSFDQADVHYLANLCHNCGACLHACQYAPPHEFAVNVPQAMARVRLQTYARFAWPSSWGVLYRRNGWFVLGVFLAALATLWWWAARASLATAQLADWATWAPHALLVTLFAPMFLWSIVALAVGVQRFWGAISPAADHPTQELQTHYASAFAESAHDAVRLRYLDGGHGEGCHNEDDRWTHARRRFHHATLLGFTLCFAATALATVYHYLFGWVAPYDLPSLPKLLGVAGGVSLGVGSLGLLLLHLRRHPLHGDAAQKPMDRAFILLLFATAVTGLGLWLARLQGWVFTPPVLALHLACVMTLFVTMPYGKFVHGFYRGAALAKYALERRLPNRLGLGSD
jgi:citrate/tricarballylate utilization protein